MNPTRYGQMVLELREAQITDEQIARYCGVDRTTVQRWVNERHIPRLVPGDQLVELFNISKVGISKWGVLINSMLDQGLTLDDIAKRCYVDPKTIKRLRAEPTHQPRHDVATALRLLATGTF